MFATIDIFLNKLLESNIIPNIGNKIVEYQKKLEKFSLLHK